MSSGRVVGTLNRGRLPRKANGGLVTQRPQGGRGEAEAVMRDRGVSGGSWKPLLLPTGRGLGTHRALVSQGWRLGTEAAVGSAQTAGKTA